MKEPLGKDSMEAFLGDHGVTPEEYLNVVDQTSIRRPTVVFKRNMSQRTNTCNSWIGNAMISNTDLQFILDEFSSASYVADYVSESVRNEEISNLQHQSGHLLANASSCGF